MLQEGSECGLADADFRLLRGGAQQDFPGVFIRNVEADGAGTFIVKLVIDMQIALAKPVAD